MPTKPETLPTEVADPLPIETVRDLLGIVRALYALQRNKGNHGHARELQSAGKRLRRALELVMHAGDREAHAAAWQLADAAIASVARLQIQSRSGDDLTAVIRLASDRVRVHSGECRLEREDREARRQARIKRG